MSTSNYLNASAIKRLHYEWNLKILSKLRNHKPTKKLKGIFKYQEDCKSLIATAFTQWLVYHIDEKIKNARVVICPAAQI